MSGTPATQPLDHRLLASHAYGLVAAECLAELPGDVPRLPTAQGALADSAALLPVLVPLRTLPAQTIGALQEDVEAQAAAGEAPLFCALLDSAASPERLQAHLGLVQLITGPAGRRAWLRLHDARVWLQLRRLLSEAQLGAILGPITRWSVLVQGELVSHESAAVVPARRLHADAQDWERVMRIGVVNRVLARRDMATAAEVDRHSPAVDALVQRGQERHGLSRTEELVEYACLGLAVHPRFDEHPEVLRMLARDASPDAVMDTLLSIDPESRERIDVDLRA